MAHSLNPSDCYQLINLIAKEATGQNDTLQAIDSSSFVSVGETILATGTENVLNAISRVVGRTFMAVRPYNAPLILINAINSGLFTERMRKISFYSKDAQASGAFNTNLYTQHGAGLDNGVNQIVSGSILPTGGLPNMWEQNPAIPLEVNFSGRDVWDDSITVYEVQLQNAFRSEQTFSEFMAGIMTEKGNDIESQKEAFNRMTLLNYIAGIYDMGVTTQVVDLKAAFNRKFGTSYKSDQLLSTYLKEFTQFFVSTYKTISDRMTLRSKLYHWSPDKTIGGVTYSLLRHTPRDRQRALLYGPLFNDAEAQVMSGIFNPEYLDIGRFEKVQYWQAISDPMKIDITPAIPNKSNPTSQTAGTRVQLDNVIGLLFDEDALMVDYQMDSAYSTPIESRKLYRNVWYHFSKNAINDFTENAVLFILGNDA